MNIKIYSTKNNSYFVRTLYKSGKDSAKIRISKKEYLDALGFAKKGEGKTTFDLDVRFNEFSFLTESL